MSELPAIVVETAAQVDAAVIWLHGLGADGHDFLPIVQQLQLPASAAIRFLFPHAPVRPISINQGMSMRGWYDLYGLTADAPQDRDGIENSSQRLAALVQQQMAQGIDSRRIILAGFSQGGAVALHCGLRIGVHLNAVMALSTYLCLAEDYPAALGPYARQTPVFMAHGRQDEVLDYSLGRHSADRLIDMQIEVDWREYDMPHSVCGEEVGDIRQWLLHRLSI